MDYQSVAYIGFDTSKTKHAVAVAEGGREGEVRYLGEIEAAPAAVERLLRKLARQFKSLHVCYEAGPTGYGLYRHIRALGQVYDVIAPSLVPIRPGDRVKTNRRDAVTLARLLRAGELTAVWVPDEVHEAVRDLVRAREAAARDLTTSASRCCRFCFVTDGSSRAIATGAERTSAGWRGRPSAPGPAGRLSGPGRRRCRRPGPTRAAGSSPGRACPTWSMAPVVAACQAMRGVSFLVP